MRYKLVAFDLDGTLADGTDSVWATLHEFFGLKNHPRRLELREKFWSGKINYRRWAIEDLKLLKEHGANKETVMKAIARIRLMKGARETLERLKSDGCKIAIISGSFQIVLEKVMPDYKRFFDYVYISRIFFSRNGGIRKIDARHDFKNKSKSLAEICRAEGIRTQDCAFVGDHDNDVEIAKLAGFSIAFNSKSEKLNAVCDAVIRKKDLREILRYV